MPYPRQHSGRRWAECYVCGIDWPLRELRRDSFGTRRCPRCWDQDGFEENFRYVTLRLEEMEEENAEGDRI
jgi:hypothetical protein